MKNRIRKQWRRRYDYVCKKCGELRYTVKYQRKINEICTICDQGNANENQNKLF